MKALCQTCGQILPKTAVMCPNCGGRSFASVDDTQVDQHLHSVSGQPMASNATPTNPWHAPQQTVQPPVIQPVMQQPQTGYVSNTGYQAMPNQPPAYQPNYQNQPGYMSPVAPPQTLQPQPVTTPPIAPQAVEPQSSYPAPAPTLPQTYGKKLASNMQYAGFLRRGFAYAFDLVLIGLLLALGYQLGVPELEKQLGIRNFTDQSLIAAGVAIYLFYMALFTSLGRQATIGKIIMGLWVFGMQGQRINFFQSLFREVIKVLLLPLFFIMWFTARKQTFADFVARTVVLYDPN